jgi:HlyD family secretion protein
VIAPRSPRLPVPAVARNTQHATNTEHALVTTFAHRGIPLVAGAMLAALAGCTKKEAEASLVTTAPVERRDIVVEAEATGSVEPVDTVAVKSIAGGLVLRMPVEVGSSVKPGDLLVQIDTRDLRNQYEQARANLVAAQAQLTVATAARERAERLGAARIITAAERESATATFASAQSAVVTARTNVDIARQRLDDATVRAQVAGTVISKPVSVGTVITSATSSASGGTTLLTIADLSRVRMRALVNETDIGSVQVGQPATVTVDAFPDRRFTGTVEKIEPQAVVEQSVTMFPVLVSLQNPSGALLPGMNGEITMRVQERTDVIAVPNDAVRSVRDMATAAQALGLSADSVRTLMQAQAAGGRAGGAQGGDVGQTVAVTDSACAAVTAALGRAPGVQPALDSLRQQMRDGAIEMADMRTRAQALYQRAGVEPRTAMACQRRRGAGGAGPGGAAGGGAAAWGGGGRGSARGASRGVVFVRDSGGWSPRFVQIGISNFDHTEVRGNVRPGEQVALLGAALLQAQRQQQNDRIRSATAGPLGGGAAGARGAGGGGGGGRGGPR